MSPADREQIRHDANEALANHEPSGYAQLAQHCLDLLAELDQAHHYLNITGALASVRLTRALQAETRLADLTTPPTSAKPNT